MRVIRGKLQREREMERGSCSTRVVEYMKETGLWTEELAEVMRDSLMATNTKGTLLMGKLMEREFTLGAMGNSMMASGKGVLSTDLEFGKVSLSLVTVGIYNDSYIGDWVMSKAQGYGVHVWKNGDRYEGEWY